MTLQVETDQITLFSTAINKAQLLRGTANWQISPGVCIIYKYTIPGT